MSRRIPGIALIACLLLATSADAADAAAPTPLAKPDDTYVSLQVQGCANRCPSFELYVFENGLVKFRSHGNTSAKGTKLKNGSPDMYRQITKYLEESAAFGAKPECTTVSPDTSVATASSVSTAQTRTASWSSSCAEQRETGRTVVKKFVNQTGTWRMINSDMRWWEKYWEDPERTGRKDVEQ